jgi:hypothetical protein
VRMFPLMSGAEEVGTLVDGTAVGWVEGLRVGWEVG